MRTEARPISVVIADDPLFRSGLRYEITQRPALRLVGEAADGAEALELVLELRPDVALLDMRLPRLSGADVIRVLVERRVATRALVLSAFNDQHAVYEAMTSGASGYLLKDLDREDICDGGGGGRPGRQRAAAGRAGQAVRRDARSVLNSERAAERPRATGPVPDRRGD